MIDEIERLDRNEKENVNISRISAAEVV